MAFYAGQKLRASNLGQLASTAQYSGSATQTIATATDTIVDWSTADVTSDFVTRVASGAGHYFTLNESGLWAISALVRWTTTGASATGQKSMHIEDSLGLWYWSSTVPASSSIAITNSVSFTKYMASGSRIQVEVYQDSGGNEDLDYSALQSVPRIQLVCILKDS